MRWRRCSESTSWSRSPRRPRIHKPSCERDGRSARVRPLDMVDNVRGPSSDADRMAERRARRRLIEELRCSPPPSVFKIILYGLGAGTGAATITGLLYLLLFGVLGTLLDRFSTEPVLVGYKGPLLPTFASSLFWNSVTT